MNALSMRAAASRGAARALVSGFSAAVLIILLTAALLGGGYVLRREWLTYKVEALLAEPSGRDVAGRLKTLADLERACGDPCSVRAQLAAAAIRTQAALATTSPAVRRQLLARALADVESAETREPANGDAALQRAYLTVLTAPSETAPSVIQALRDSYAKAPFALKGGWRLVYAGRYWTALDRPLRTAVLDEAAWLVAVKPRLRPQVEAAFTDQAGQFALALRLHCSTRCAPSRQASRISVPQ